MENFKINDLVQFAASKAVKKPKKDAAFDALLRLIKGDDVTYNEKAGLVSYFIPPVPKKSADTLGWIKKHTAQQDVRFYLNYFYVSGTHIVSTNGHYLAKTENIYGLENGFYNPKTGLKENIDARFPEYNRVIPSEEKTIISLHHCPSAVYATKKQKFAKFVRVFTLPDGLKMAFNNQYYESICSNPSGVLSMRTADATSAMKIIFNDLSIGVLMPMRVDLDDLIID